jgi:hypothetical protein
LVLASLAYRFYDLEPLHGWADDGSGYLMLADNLLHGRPYAEVYVAVSPGNEVPLAIYPPLFPAVLAPALAIWGLNFYAFKVLMLLFFAASVCGVWRVLRDLLSPEEALASTSLLLLSPVWWNLADHILSEFFTLVLQCLFLHSVHRLPWGRDVRGWQAVWRPFFPAFFCVLSVFARTAAFTQAVAVALYVIFLHRRITRPLVTFLGWVLALGLPLAGFVFVFGRYGGQFGTLSGFQATRRNVIDFLLVMGDFFPMKTGLVLVLTGVTLLGCWLLFGRTKHVWFFLAFAYAPVVIVWPFADMSRFLVPVIPLMMAGLVHVTGLVARHLSPRLAAPAFVGLVALMWAASWPIALSPREVKLGGAINNEEAKNLYAAVKEAAKPDSLFAFAKPRTLTLMAGVKSVQHGRLPPQNLVQDLCLAHATHVVAGDQLTYNQDYLEPMLKQYESSLKLIYRSAHFRLFEWNRALCMP